MSYNSLFLSNKYTSWYYAIITNAQDRISDGYRENHHIIPKSLGGDNSIENLVKLTAREHFICHWLLTKMVENKKHKYQMWNAFSCMLYRELPGKIRYKITGRIFENVKKEGAKIKSSKFTGTGNPMYGRKYELNPLFGIKKSPEHIEKIRQGNLGTVRSLESRNKQSKKMKGRKQSLEHIANRSGVNHPGYGKAMDSQRKEKIRQGVLNMPLHTCEHCGKTTTKGNYKRWHSDNCKVMLGV
jgi:5-methylcytosine-specific restriction endonuclease McrA